MTQSKATSQLQSSLRDVERLSPTSCSLHIVSEKGGKVLRCFSGIYSPLVLGYFPPKV